MRTKYDAKIDLLGHLPLFRSCTSRELVELAKITTESQVPAGRILCHEGEIGRECFVVVEGEAMVTMSGARLADLGPGDLFGEMALLDDDPRVASVTAATDMRLLVLSRAEFQDLLAKMPTVTRRILRGVAARLRAADHELHPGPVDAWDGITADRVSEKRSHDNTELVGVVAGQRPMRYPC
jgi:CRP-like cAMP-binding protein